MNDIISNVKVYGLNESIKRAKYPFAVDINEVNDELTDGIKKLGQSERGAGHDQFMTGIIVQFDLTLTVKAWVEAERYGFLDFISSQSTMHRITKFDLDKAYIPYVDKRIIEIMKEKVNTYNQYVLDIASAFIPQSQDIINSIEDKKKEMYLEILYSNPCGFRLTAGMTTNYRQLKTIYAQRKNHKLPEWRSFCKWIETLPHSELIIGENK